MCYDIQQNVVRSNMVCCCFKCQYIKMIQNDILKWPFWHGPTAGVRRVCWWQWTHFSFSWHFQSIYRGFRTVRMWFFLCYTKKSSQLRLTIYQCIAIVSKLRFVLLDLNKKRNGMEWNEKKCVFVEYEISYHQNIMIQINQKQKHCIKWSAIVTRSICVMCMWHRELSIRSRIPQKRTQSQFSKLKLKKRLLQIYYTAHITFFVALCVCSFG